MEKYLTNTDLTSQNDTQDSPRGAPGSARFKPYTILERKCGPKKKNLLDLLPESGNPPSSSSVTKLLLKTLKEATNPIAHSDLYERTGHQVSESRRNHRPYLQERSRKLAVQKETINAAEQPQILSNVKVYIDGFLTGTTDIEMKRVVSRAGGQILYSASGATHILSSQSLSGSKTHRLLSKKTRISVHVVRPEWVFDSIKAGKRRPERDYTILKNSSTLNIAMMVQKQK
ncbi:hypothetical protein HHX47_DHR5000521 [Lentinula edodes]|nr:hypothetical protein HHX47_DHR5000521 [Lentinula edodes]